MARIRLFLTYPFDPTHRFETSWLVSPKILFFIRALISLYIFTVLLFNIGYNCARPSLGGCDTSRDNFSYFTVLSYWGLGFYFLISAFHTFMYARRGTSPLNSWPRALQWLHSVYYSTATVFPFLVIIVFWSLLSSPTTLSTTYSAWSNISQHALNAVFATIEIVLPRTSPAPWDHLPVQLFLVALYLALAYITHATKGFYTYSFLDPGLQGSLVAAYVFGIAIGICILFAVIQGLIWVRRWATEEKLGWDGVFVQQKERKATTQQQQQGHADIEADGASSRAEGADGDKEEGGHELTTIHTATQTA
ncbi:hypothetical protein EV127DRAFT_484304 [Xylaria flabelliformis]|nr:hypothetical protein EV127DRAFT_484304 [Xylaria flabelliformis]